MPNSTFAGRSGVTNSGSEPGRKVSPYLEVGATVSSYRIERLLDQGGMAVVYEATDLRLDRRVALKILAGQQSQGHDFRERFLRESRFAASLDHPNIVPIYEAGEADGLLYIAMRYVRGSNLSDVVHRDGPLAPGRVLAILSPVADALDTAHATGLVHRDVKPANILLASGRDGHEHVYLSDFGLTKRTSALTKLTAAGHFIGTMAYIAPEQIRGEPLDARTDLYAFGCVAYECLTGVPPFVRDDQAALLWAHLSQDPSPISEVRPELPAVDDIVARAMAKNPSDRYQTCEQFTIALGERLGTDRPHRAEPVTGLIAPDSESASTGTALTPHLPPPASRGAETDLPTSAMVLGAGSLVTGGGYSPAAAPPPAALPPAELPAADSPATQAHLRAAGPQASGPQASGPRSSEPGSSGPRPSEPGAFQPSGSGAPGWPTEPPRLSDNDRGTPGSSGAGSSPTGSGRTGGSPPPPAQSAPPGPPVQRVDARRGGNPRRRRTVIAVATAAVVAVLVTSVIAVSSAGIGSNQAGSAVIAQEQSTVETTGEHDHDGAASEAPGTVDSAQLSLSADPLSSVAEPTVAAPAAPIPTPAVVIRDSMAIPTAAGSIAVDPTPGFVTITPNGKLAYIAHREAGIVSVLDTTSNSIVARITISGGPPHFIAFAPDGKTAYVSIYTQDFSVNLVQLLDIRTSTPRETVTVGERPYALAVTPDQQQVWVPSHNTGAIDIIDTTTKTVVSTLPVAKNPHWVTFGRDGKVAYIANHESNLLSAYDTATHQLIKEIPVGQSAHSVAVSPDGTEVAVVCFDSNNVYFLDTATNEIKNIVDVGTNPQDVTYTPDGRYAYVANVESDNVSVIDTATKIVTATVPTDSPTSIAFLPDGSRAYVTNLETGTLTMLNTAW